METACLYDSLGDWTMVELNLKGAGWCKVLFENKIMIEIKLLLEMRECRIYLHLYSINSSSDVGSLAKPKAGAYEDEGWLPGAQC